MENIRTHSIVRSLSFLTDVIIVNGVYVVTSFSFSFFFIINSPIQFFLSVVGIHVAFAATFYLISKYTHTVRSQAHRFSIQLKSAFATNREIRFFGLYLTTYISTKSKRKFIIQTTIEPFSEANWMMFNDLFWNWQKNSLLSGYSVQKKTVQRTAKHFDELILHRSSWNTEDKYVWFEFSDEWVIFFSNSCEFFVKKKV